MDWQQDVRGLESGCVDWGDVCRLKCTDVRVGQCWLRIVLVGWTVWMCVVCRFE